jgi:hypothetical protein
MGVESKWKVSLTEARKILNKNGEKYSDEDIARIIDFLQILAELDYQIFLNLNNKQHEKEGDIIRKGIN